jgi:hypothetical protein
VSWRFHQFADDDGSCDRFVTRAAVIAILSLSAPHHQSISHVNSGEIVKLMRSAVKITHFHSFPRYQSRIDARNVNHQRGIHPIPNHFAP